LLLIDVMLANAIAVCKFVGKTLPSAVGVKSIIGVMTLDASKSSPNPCCDGKSRRIVACSASLVTRVICAKTNFQ